MSNKAKKWQEGTYTVSVCGSSIAIAKRVKVNEDKLGFPVYKNVIGLAQCCPEDEFDLVTGLNLAMDRVNEKIKPKNIQVGDTVKIIDSSKCYTTLKEWVAKNVTDITKAIKYAYSCVPDETELAKTFKVLYTTTDIFNNKLVYVESEFLEKACYLINVKGLKKVTE